MLPICITLSVLLQRKNAATKGLFFFFWVIFLEINPEMIVCRVSVQELLPHEFHLVQTLPIAERANALADNLLLKLRAILYPAARFRPLVISLMQTLLWRTASKAISSLKPHEAPISIPSPCRHTSGRFNIVYRMRGPFMQPGERGNDRRDQMRALMLGLSHRLGGNSAVFLLNHELGTVQKHKEKHRQNKMEAFDALNDHLMANLFASEPSSVSKTPPSSPDKVVANPTAFQVLDRIKSFLPESSLKTLESFDSMCKDVTARKAIISGHPPAERVQSFFSPDVTQGYFFQKSLSHLVKKVCNASLPFEQTFQCKICVSFGRLKAVGVYPFCCAVKVVVESLSLCLAPQFIRLKIKLK